MRFFYARFYLFLFFKEFFLLQGLKRLLHLPVSQLTCAREAQENNLLFEGTSFVVVNAKVYRAFFLKGLKDHSRSFYCYKLYNFLR